jgi:hypothetical protein
MKKNPLEVFEGQDKIIGRPLRLNRVTLPVNEKGYAPLLFFGDLHIGSPQCDLEAIQAMLDWALQDKVHILVMGDVIDANLRDSVGWGVYEQKLSPQQQIEFAINLFKPLAEQGLIIGYHTGN